jgi:hypothetical protein
MTESKTDRDIGMIRSRNKQTDSKKQIEAGRKTEFLRQLKKA